MPGARPRARRGRQRAVASVIAVVVVAGATAVAKWPHAWWWLIAATAVAAALATPAVSAVTSAAERRSDTARRIRTGLQGTIGNDGGRLPNVAHANLEARVHRAVLPIPYIPRDEEDQVRQHLLAGNPVLIVGSSMVGKTRMAAKVIAEMFGFKSAIIPDSKTALASLDVNIQASGLGIAVCDRWLRFGGGCGVAAVAERGFRDDRGL